MLSGWNVTRLGSAVLGGGSLPQPSFSCRHIPGVSLGQPRSFFHTLVPAPAGSGEGERAVSMATSLFVISYFLFYGFSRQFTDCGKEKCFPFCAPLPPSLPPAPQAFSLLPPVFPLPQPPPQAFPPQRPPGFPSLSAPPRAFPLQRPPGFLPSSPLGLSQQHPPRASGPHQTLQTFRGPAIS